MDDVFGTLCIGKKPLRPNDYNAWNYQITPLNSVEDLEKFGMPIDKSTMESHLYFDRTINFAECRGKSNRFLRSMEMFVNEMLVNHNYTLDSLYNSTSMKSDKSENIRDRMYRLVLKDIEIFPLNKKKIEKKF